MTQKPSDPRYEGNEIAVCGMAGRFPGAPDVDTFWKNLCEGRESIARFSDEELLAAGVDAGQLADPRYVKSRPILDDIESWDAGFFGFSPREAEILDPQHRLFLECAFEALEDAACDSERHKGGIGVFAGASFSNYLVHNLYANRPALDAFGDVPATILNVQDSLVTMAGYKFDLRGPCCAVQTFCSTSLVAVHLAAQSLLNYESDVALAGGVTVYVPQRSGYLYEDGGIVSPDGHCRAFDARASGTVFGSGVGVVVLKRLTDALAARDPIRAIVRGTAMNNDGALKVSYAAPGVVGQTQVIAEALSAAGVDPETIGYVETHGTGTLLGDPAEISALTRAYRQRTSARGFCALGSVKTNVGHLDAAAGVTGLIKTVLCLERGRIPPSLNCDTPNPQIDFAGSPFFVNTVLRDWARGAKPRRAGVSAFGVGGTNAHVVLEEAPLPSSPGAASTPRPQLILVSARTETALRQARLRLAGHLRSHPELDLADVAFTLQAGRRVFGQRFAAVCHSMDEAVSRLEAEAQRRVGEAAPLRRNPPVAFVFGAGPTPRPHAAFDLQAGEPTFREAVTECATAARPFLQGADLLELLYPTGPPAADAVPLLGPPGEAALFAIELGLARLWMSWGVRPEALAGYGTGELVAACVAGVLRLEDGIRLAVLRGASVLEDAAAQAAREVRSAEPTIPIVSGLSGEVVDATIAGRPGYWMERLSKSSPTSSPRVAERLKAYRDPVVLRLEAPVGHEQESRASRAHNLEALGRLWLAGGQPDWSAVHAPLAPRRLRLPTYPFERQRHFVEPLPKEESRGPREPQKAPEPHLWLYEPVWLAGLATLPPTAPATAAGRLLLFADGLGIGAALAERLRAEGTEVTLVQPGTAFEVDAGMGYRIDPRARENYARLVADLETNGASPRRVLYLWGLEPSEEGATAAPLSAGESERVFSRLLHLLQALSAHHDPGTLEVVIGTSGLHDITGREPLHPERAPLSALATVANQEMHPLRCRVVDLEEADTGAAAQALWRELRLESPDDTVAYRAGRRWTRRFEPLAGAPSDEPLARVRAGGTYLVTGGLGNVGFVAALTLARAARVRLVLVGRSVVPDRVEWDAWLARSPAHDPTSVRIKRVRALEALGADVLVASADVADPVQMERVVGESRARFSSIDGVIHAAGLLGREDFLPLQGLDAEAAGRMFAAKIEGLLVLDRLLQSPRPEFWLLTSSLSTVLGGLGYAAYAAGNAFLDGFALARNREDPGRFTSVDLDQWHFGSSPTGGNRAAANAITPNEGIRLFQHLIRTGVAGQVVVSTTPLAPRLARAIGLADAKTSASPEPTAPARLLKPRPPLAAPYLAPRDAPEQAVIGIFEELLGVGPLGVHDDFFELGGHSLFAARVLSRLRDAFGVALPLAAFFEKPTAGGLAARISASLMAREATAPPLSPSADRVEIEI